MNNIATKIEGGMLWIGIDMNQTSGPTKSGKGMNVALTGGYKALPENSKFKFNLHLYRNKTEEEKKDGC